MNNSRDYTARLFLDNVEIIHKDKEVISRDAENLPETIIKEEVEFNTGRTDLDFFYEEIYPFLYYYGIVFIWITSIIVSIRVSRVNGYSEKELKDIIEFLEAQKTQNK